MCVCQSSTLQLMMMVTSHYDSLHSHNPLLQLQLPCDCALGNGSIINRGAGANVSSQLAVCRRKRSKNKHNSSYNNTNGAAVSGSEEERWLAAPARTPMRTIMVAARLGSARRSLMDCRGRTLCGVDKRNYGRACQERPRGNTRMLAGPFKTHTI